MNDQANKLMRIMENVSAGASDLGWMTSLVIPSYEQDDSPENAKSVISGVVTDLRNCAVCARWINAIDEALVEHGNPSSLARSLAAHSSGTSRLVGKFLAYAPRSASGHVGGELFRWLARLGPNVVELVEVVDDKQAPWGNPEFWERLAKAVEREVDGSTQIDQCLCIGELLIESGRLPGTLADDAIDEIYTFVEKINANTSGNPLRTSEDFRCVLWNGGVLEFTPNQAAIVGILYKNFENNTPIVSGDTLLNESGSEAKSVREVFDKGEHSAWGTMIVPGERKNNFQIIPNPAENQT